MSPPARQAAREVRYRSLLECTCLIPCSDFELTSDIHPIFTPAATRPAHDQDLPMSITDPVPQDVADPTTDYPANALPSATCFRSPQGTWATSSRNRRRSGGRAVGVHRLWFRDVGIRHRPCMCRSDTEPGAARSRCREIHSRRSAGARVLSLDLYGGTIRRNRRHGRPAHRRQGIEYSNLFDLTEPGGQVFIEFRNCSSRCPLSIASPTVCSWIAAARGLWPARDAVNHELASRLRMDAFLLRDRPTQAMTFSKLDNPLTVPALFGQRRFPRCSCSLLPLPRRHALPAVRRPRGISTRMWRWKMTPLGGAACPRICVRYSRTTARPSSSDAR